MNWLHRMMITATLMSSVTAVSADPMGASSPSVERSIHQTMYRNIVGRGVRIKQMTAPSGHWQVTCDMEAGKAYMVLEEASLSEHFTNMYSRLPFMVPAEHPYRWHWIYRPIESGTVTLQAARAARPQAFIVVVEASALWR